MNELVPPPSSEHLSELAIDRYLYEAMAAADTVRIESHLAACPRCNALVQEIRAFDASVTTGLKPPVVAPAHPLSMPNRRPETPESPIDGPVVIPFRPAIDRKKSRRKKSTRWLPIALAAAAVGAFALLSTLPSSRIEPPAPEDGYRTKGSSFEVEFHVHDGERSRQVDRGDRVRPGERIGFRVAAPSDGYLLIVGIDETLEPYVCYPQAGDGHAERFDGFASPTAIDEAMVFDEVLGHERLIALWCPDPIALQDFRDRLVSAASDAPPDRALGSLKQGCLQRDIVLNKR